MENPLIAGAITDSLGFNAADLVATLDSLNNLDVTEISKVTTLVAMIRNMTECLASDRLQGFATEAELEVAATELNTDSNLLAG